MAWRVAFFRDFKEEFDVLPPAVQEEMLALVQLLKSAGPLLRRPYADTLKGSRHANLKELRFGADGGVWRVAYAFDPSRKAILLVAGDKSGIAGARFYGRLIKTADSRLDRHLMSMKDRKEQR